MATRKSAAKSTRGKANKVATTSGKTAGKSSSKATTSASGKDARMRVVPARDIGAISDSMLPVQRFRRVHAIHEYAGTAFELAFFSTKRLRNSLVRTRPGPSDSLTAHRWLARGANQIT